MRSEAGGYHGPGQMLHGEPPSPGVGFVNTMWAESTHGPHSLGALYGIPHGLANSIMLPIVMDYNVKMRPSGS